MDFNFGSYSGTTVAGQDLIPILAENERIIQNQPEYWVNRFGLMKYMITVAGACDVQINNGTILSLAAGEKFSDEDININSFITVTGGVVFRLDYGY